MTNLERVLTYHEQSKHSPSRYAASLGYMDWDTQPDPFRSYSGAKEIDLHFPNDEKTPTYSELFLDNATASEINIETISQFFRYSLGLAAIKSFGGNSWALRCNASSGNLQPSEAYAILPIVEGISNSASIVHYAPKNHKLELLKSYSSEVSLNSGFFVVISSIAWREVWKYGERAFRYCQLDAGHAYRALQISARMLGWHTQMLHSISDEKLDSILGFDVKERFHDKEEEHSELIFFVSGTKFSEEIRIDEKLFENIGLMDSVANRLSSAHHDWPIVESIYRDCKKPAIEDSNKKEDLTQKISSKNSAEVVLTRRSAQQMNPNERTMSKELFFEILNGVSHDLEGMDSESHVSLLIFIHGVKDIEAGLYVVIRNRKHFESMSLDSDDNFEWQPIANSKKILLYRLKSGDFKYFAKASSCNQDIASDGTFSISMLCEFDTLLADKGAWYYKYLYYECGQIGQQLYLDSTANGYSATGIGCFLDDIIHQVMGFKSKQFQVLYNFTVGSAVLDSRLQTISPYKN